MKVIHLNDVMKFLGIDNLEKKKTIRTTHGPCCCCQFCGHSYDDCVCEHNSNAEWINNVFFELEIVSHDK